MIGEGGGTRERVKAAREGEIERRRTLHVCIAGVALALLPSVVLSAQTVDPQGLSIRAIAPTGPATAVRTDPRAIQARVNVLLTRLAMPQSVHVEVVEDDGDMASVKPIDDGCTTFDLMLDAGFLESLSEEELTAVLAHELGHVWVFTHHPYLQTEKLANEIALRLVTRDSLVQLYGKLWQRKGTKGDLGHVVGD